ncbi:MAG TPA: aspartate dehydrogenase, partial [Burkholderiales bacterium]|nr:aspartate dehydrogenase [Burkholderiales bacterium]
ASQEAVARYGPAVLEAGCNLLVLSVGAFADSALLTRIDDLARRRHANVYLPSGAIAGLDALKAVRNSARTVTLTTAKPPAALGVTTTSRRVLFEGTAREAVAKFPRNVNVAASVSLAGIGPQRTTVRVVADPALTRNTHEVHAEGDFGTLTVRVESEPSETNPATSKLAYLSAIALLRQLQDPVKVGT